MVGQFESLKVGEKEKGNSTHLLNQPNVRSQPLDIEIPNLPLIERNSPTKWRHPPLDQADNRALPRSAWPHDSGCFVSRDNKIESLENLDVGPR